jgi:hypothetical protein
VVLPDRVEDLLERRRERGDGAASGGEVFPQPGGVFVADRNSYYTACLE